MRLLPLLLLSLPSLPAQTGWWMQEPIRWVQANLRETDAGLDPAKLIQDVTRFHANVLHLGMGGIAAYYPTQVPFHYASPHLPAGRDTFGEVLRLAHQRGIRVVGRFDFSKTRKDVHDAHPEWFFRQANGQPVIYNGLYSTCINGGYYRTQVMAILTEALERYDVDGLFFNMFGNQSRDYSGKFVGHCHCDTCRRLYRDAYQQELPAEPNEQYRQFMFRSSREVSSAIGALIREKRPKAGYFNYIQESTDGIMSESNTAVNRPLPHWPYSASDNVNRARNSEPSKMAINLCMQFVDFAWRFATVPAQEIALRLWQNVAQGGAAAFAINGTFAQQDRQALEAAAPVYEWLSANQQYYVGQESAAGVLLLGGSARTGRTFNQASYRGVYRWLSEQHIPFAVSDNLNWMGHRKYSLVIATDWAPPELQTYVQNGGRLLLASATPPEFPIAAVTRTHATMEGYLRVRNPILFPSLGSTSLLLLNGPFTELAAPDDSMLTLVPPSMIGPPEKIHIDQRDTAIPGMVRRKIGQGELIWLPWDLGALYYRLSLPAHAGLLHDLIESLGEGKRQLRTNAHPLVEISVMRQKGRTLVHLINLSGHSQTAYFAPVPMTDIRLELEGRFTSARSLRSPAQLAVTSTGGGTKLTVPTLRDYELIVLSPR